MLSFVSVYYPYAIAIFTVLLLNRWRRKAVSRLPYPPGPKGLPLIGNVRDIPSKHEWLAYSQWSREYDSSLIHLNLTGTHLIVVNSSETALELFDKRSAIYSDRPHLPMLGDLIGWDAFSMYRYGSRWRTARRIFHHYFNSTASPSYQPRQTKSAHELLYRLACTPEDFWDHVHLTAGSVILNIVYGIDAQSIVDPYIMIIEKANEAAKVASNPGSFLVDTIPLLKYVPEWFPGARFQTIAKELRSVAEAGAEVPYQHVKDAMAKGEHISCMTSLALEKFKGNKEAEEVLRGTCFIAYIGGGDTTTSTLYTFFLAMVLYPEVVRKAHEELDAVIGQYRLPECSDLSSLPYICAIVKEVLRWHPVAPLAVVHRLMEDDVFEGQFLPGGSLVLGNVWAILHDERDYKDPDTFNPERFLKDGQLDPDVKPPEDAVFGFGRRICPGRHVALASLFLYIASILATFNIGKATDENGDSITPKEEFTTGLLSIPCKFKCSIMPRSREASDLIAETYAEHHPQP